MFMFIVPSINTNRSLTYIHRSRYTINNTVNIIHFIIPIKQLYITIEIGLYHHNIILCPALPHNSMRTLFLDSL